MPFWMDSGWLLDRFLDDFGAKLEPVLRQVGAKLAQKSEKWRCQKDVKKCVKKKSRGTCENVRKRATGGDGGLSITNNQQGNRETMGIKHSTKNLPKIVQVGTKNPPSWYQTLFKILWNDLSRQVKNHLKSCETICPGRLGSKTAPRAKK